MRALGAYIFAGGFTLGVKQHFDVQAVFEADAYGVATMRHNQPEIPVFIGKDAWPRERYAGTIDFLYGNPPCAAWSQAGKVIFGGDWRTDPRVDCTRIHFGLLEDVRPTFWAWESVPRAFTAGRELVDELTRRAVAMGYSVTYLLHNARYLGLAQDRPRFFFVAHQRRFDVEDYDFKTVNTCGAVLSRINDPGEPFRVPPPGHQALFPHQKQGESALRAWERLNPDESKWRVEKNRVIGRPSFADYYRLRADQPSNAVVGYSLVHPHQDRILTMREMKALSGFPDDYEFIGSGPAQQLARGVCPPVGAWLAKNVRRCLERDETDPHPVVQLIDVRKPPGIFEVLPLPGEAVATAAPTRETTVSTVSVAAPADRPAPQPTAVSVPQSARLGVIKPKDGLRVGAYIRLLITMGYDTKKILEGVRRFYPESRATASDVSWNRGKLRKDGVPTTTLPQPSSTAPARSAVSPTATGPVQLLSEPQATRTSQRPSHVDPERVYDTTSLRARQHGKWIHRDYGAHFFRWGFAGRLVKQDATDVLDVGCGPDLPLLQALTHPRCNVPKRYLGVDYGNPPAHVPSRQWAQTLWNFDFLERHGEVGQFDIVTCLEVIEHMRKPDGLKLLAALRACARPGGRVVLSTPVFNGRAAANHLHEWTVAELAEAISDVGMRVEQRYGTFINANDLRRVATADELALYDKLSGYYDHEVMALFLAPLYPDAARNNLWVLGHD